MEKVEYFFKVGITRTAPKTVMFFDDMANTAGNILFGAISFLLQKITGKSASGYNSTVLIYKKKGFWHRKELLYEEIIPEDVHLDQVSMKANAMIMRLQEQGDQLIKDLIIGRSRIFQPISKTMRDSIYNKRNLN